MADISPELAARIEELRIKHEENPAKFFMSLAREYREAGMLAEAEELLREHLKRHPGYLSAHVLLGGCLADRGARAEARNEFTYVLSIDSQNLIALRTLGEMAAAEGDTAEARRWYDEWLAVDPMSGEARRAVDALTAGPPSPEAAAGAWDPFAHGEVGGTDEAAPPAAPAAEAEFGVVDLEAPAEAAVPEPATEPEPLDLPEWGEVSLAEEASPEPPAEPVPDSAVAAFGMVDLSAPAPGGDAPAAGDEWADWSAASGIELPSTPALEAAAPADEVELAGALDLPPLESAAVAAPVRAEVAPVPTGDDELGDVGQVPEVLTETMAELLYGQGHLDRAADVYRELLRRGGDDALARRLAEIEAEMRGEVATPVAPEPDTGDAEEFSPLEEASAETVPAWVEVMDAVTTGVTRGVEEALAPSPAAAPQSVAAYLGALLSWHPGPREEAAVPLAVEPEPAATVPAPSEEAESGAWELPAPATTAAVSEPDLAASAETELPQPEPTVEPASEALQEGAEPLPWALPELEATASASPGPVGEAEAEAEPLPWALPEPEGAAESAGEPVQEHVADAESEPLPWAIPAPETEAAGEPETVQAVAEEAPLAAETAAPPAAMPWDEEILGASEAQPPLDEPWIAPAAVAAAAEVETPAVAPRDAFADSFEQGFAGATETAAVGQAEEVEEMPWLVDELTPVEAPAESEATPSDEGAAAAMPWEEAPAPAPGPPAEPATGGAPAGTGFSFEDFFTEPPAAEPAAPAAAPAPSPAPAPAPAPAAPEAAAAEDDEDLESFQAWLQSLKR